MLFYIKAKIGSTSLAYISTKNGNSSKFLSLNHILGMRMKVVCKTNNDMGYGFFKKIVVIIKETVYIYILS